MAASDTYIKLHDGMPDHPKVDPLSDAAFRLLINSWCWCSRHLTDGAMPVKTWVKRGTKKTRDELVAAGLVEQHDADVILWHDYLEHQQSAEQRQAAREQRREAGRAGGLARGKRVAKQKASESLSESPSEIQAEVEVEVEEQPKTSSLGTRKRATAVPDIFPITESMAEWGREHAPSVKDPAGETRQFLDHHRAKGTSMKDWQAGWRTWMRNAQKWSTSKDKPALAPSAAWLENM